MKNENTPSDTNSKEITNSSYTELPPSHELYADGYKYIIFRQSIRRQCQRQPPLNKEYSWFWVKCWSHLGVEKDDPTGPDFNCRRIELTYNHGAAEGIDTNSIGHHASEIRHCHGATLTGRFRAYEGNEFKVLTNSI